MKRAWHQNFKRAPVEKRTSREGITFHSKTEMERWEYLQLLQKAGAIISLERQVKFPLVREGADPIRIMSGKQVAKYTADFRYMAHTGGGTFEQMIEDVKGHQDKASAFRIAVFEALTGHKVTLVTKDGGRWLLN